MTKSKKTTEMDNFKVDWRTGEPNEHDAGNNFCWAYLHENDRVVPLFVGSARDSWLEGDLLFWAPAPIPMRPDIALFGPGYSIGKNV